MTSRTAPPADDAVTAGRGFLLIAGAKVWFILASATIALGLPRLLGNPARFGDFRVTNSLVTVLNMVLILGTIQSVSRLVSEDPQRARSLRRTALKLQLVLGGGVALTLGLFATPITRLLFADTRLAPYLQIGMCVTFLYAVYAVFVGLLNGQRLFGAQAALDMLFSTLKASLIVGLVLLGYGVLGAFIGFAIAALLVVIAAGLTVAKRLPPGPETAVPMAELIRLLAPILGSTLMVNLLLQLDVLSIKGLAFGPVAQRLGTGDAAREAASTLSGLLGGAKNLALLPYQATFALTLVVFPLLSQAAFVQDPERVRQYIFQANRFTLIVAGASALVIIAVARPALALLFGPAYAPADTALMLLASTTVGLAAFVLAVTVLNAAGHEYAALGLTGLTVLLNAALLVGLLSTADAVGPELVNRAAAASAIATGVGYVAAVALCTRRFGVVLPIATILRLAGVGAVILALGRLWPVATVFQLVLKASSLGILILAGLALTGELTPTDRATLARILGRKKT